MRDESIYRWQRAFFILGFVFPLLALLVALAGWIVASYAGEKGLWIAHGLSGLGVGLGVAYLILSVVRVRMRSPGRTGLSIFFALIVMCVAAVTFPIEYLTVYGIFGGPTRPPTLAEYLRGKALDATGPAGKFLMTGESGTITTSSWTNPDGGQVAIGISWTKNIDGLKVTASPIGPVPKGQDGTPREYQVLTNGMVGFPLDRFKQEAEREKSYSFDLFSPLIFFIDDLVEGSAGPIINYAKANKGQLPDESVAAEILSKVKKNFDVQMDQSSSVIPFTINRYAYQKVTERIFSIDYEWTVPASSMMDSARAAKEIDGGDSVTGSFTLHYTSSGLIAMSTKPEANPLNQIFEAFDRYGEEERAKADEAAKDKKKSEEQSDAP